MLQQAGPDYTTSKAVTMIRITTTKTKTTKTTTTVYQRLADDANNFFYNADVNYYQTITTSFDENVITSTAATVTHNGSTVSPLHIDGDNFSLMRANPDERVSLSWQKVVLAVLFCLLIVITVIGNTLVIMSVATTRRLRTVTNCFVMSLAVADWLVGIFVMPPAVFLFIVGSWRLGWIMCDVWISLDVLLCTASILSLCAISVDRYLAVTQPLNYSKRRRSKQLALCMIFIVWVVAAAITCPPILGWYDPNRRNADLVECHYNQNKGYVVFSAMGSFFIPMAVMLYVYSRICCVLKYRQRNISKTEAKEKACDIDIDITSEAETTPSPRQCYSTKFNHSHTSSVDKVHSHQTLYELVDQPKTKVSGGKNQLRPLTTVQFNQSQLSITEAGLSSSRFKIHSQQNRMPIRISSLRRETKTAQTLSMVVGGFILCWLPFFIYYLIMPFISHDYHSEVLMEFLTWLGWLNSAINPFIYAFYNADFRLAFWRLTLRKFYKTKTNMAFLKA